MKTITYTNNQGLELKINKFSSGQFKWAFSLTFNNGVHTFCYTMTELRTILLKNGMTPSRRSTYLLIGTGSPGDPRWRSSSPAESRS